jgi:hypothetical protein
MQDNYRFDLFMETSAKDGSNVTKLFCEAGKILYKITDDLEKENNVRKILLFSIYFHFLFDI